MVIYFDDVFLTAAMLLPLFAGLVLKKQNRLDEGTLCCLILLGGFVLRLIYFFIGDVDTRQHDVGEFFVQGDGHAAYICYIFEKMRLPDTDPRKVMEFYHPPLHHIICAAFLKAAEALGLDVRTRGVDALRLLPMMYSFLFCVFAYKTFRLLGLRESTLALCTAAVTFHPTLILLSGSLNNDMLSALFGMLALYFCVRWAGLKRWRDIILLAFSIGLGMLTKLSAGLIAPAVAAVFLFALVRSKGERLRLLGQFAAFGAVCLPLGLCWSVRNYVRFGVPPNYIPLLSENSGQFIPQRSAERLFNWLPFQFSSPFTQWGDAGAPYNEFNPVIALWKNAMFDESAFFPQSVTMQSFCTALFFAGAALSLVCAAAHVVLWRRSVKMKTEIKLLLTVSSAAVFVNYIVFCLKFPHVCTENMRYCVPLIVTLPAALGACEGEFGRRLSPLKKLAASFCALSVLVYTSLMYFSH